jgi:hypothetical protein
VCRWDGDAVRAVKKKLVAAHVAASWPATKRFSTVGRKVEIDDLLAKVGCGRKLVYVYV